MNYNEVWEILGIEPTSDKRAVRRAYAALSREHHAEEEPEIFARISEAYRMALDWSDSVGYDTTHGTDAADPIEFTHFSYLARMEEEAKKRFRERFHTGALAELIACLQDAEKCNDKKFWQEFFLREVFLAEQMEEDFMRALLQYFADLSAEERTALPKRFLLELLVAYGYTDRVKGGEGVLEFAQGILNVCFDGISGERVVTNMIRKPENQVRAGSFAAYLRLMKLSSLGLIEEFDRQDLEYLIGGAKYNLLYERSGNQENKYCVIHSACFPKLLTYWVSSYELPAWILEFMYDLYGLKYTVAESNSNKLIYGDLKNEILKREPDIEQNLYGEFYLARKRKEWLKEFESIVRKQGDLFYKHQTPYEDTEEIRERVRALFESDDWTSLGRDKELFMSMLRFLEDRLPIPEAMADYLLDYYEENHVAEKNNMLRMRDRLLMAKWYAERMRENDTIYPYVCTHNVPTEADARNEEFLYYLLHTGFDGKVGLINYINTLYYPAGQLQQKRRSASEWRKQFVGFDEQLNGIEKPLRQDILLMDGHRLTVEFHLHYLLYFLDDRQITRPLLTFEELWELSDNGMNPVEFLYLLAITKPEWKNRETIKKLISERLSASCLRPSMIQTLAELLTEDYEIQREASAEETVDDREAHGVNEIFYAEQESLCFKLTKSSHGIKLFQYHDSDYCSWDEMVIPEELQLHFDALDDEKKREFCEPLLQRLLEPASQCIGHRDVSDLSNQEKIRAVIDALKGGECHRKGRNAPCRAEEIWEADSVNEAVRDFFENYGGFMTESYCVLHVGKNAGRRFDRVFWSRMGSFGFALEDIGSQSTGLYQENRNTVLRKTQKDKGFVVGSFGWEKAYTSDNWIQPFPLCIGESGAYYTCVMDNFYKEKSFEALLDKVLNLSMVTAVDIYEGALGVYDHAFTYADWTAVTPDEEKPDGMDIAVTTNREHDKAKTEKKIPLPYLLSEDYVMGIHEEVTEKLYELIRDGQDRKIIEKALDEAVAAEPENILRYIVRAWYYSERGLRYKVNPDLFKALELEPDNILVLRALCAELIGKNHYEKQIEYYTRLLELDPVREKEYIVQRAYRYHWLGDDDKAREDIKLIHDKVPKSDREFHYLYNELFC